MSSDSAPERLSPKLDEEIEFLQEDKSQHADHEQRQGLLGAWKERETEESREEDGEWESETKSRPPRRRWLAGALIVTTVVVLSALATAWHTRGSESTGRSDAHSQGDVTTPSYVLEPEWNHASPPQRREYYWTVEDVEHNPDGVYRPMILINKQFPGPMIEVNEGDTIVVHFNNRASNATSLHWHGIYQNGTPHMDGTVGITQCAIAPGRSFSYQFTVTGQSGTYWWHGHQGAQASDGLHGPLIIHGRREKELQLIKYASDRVVMVSDHYHDLSSALLWQYLKPDNENREPVPETALLNGWNIRDCAVYPSRKCDNTSAHLSRRPTIDLTPGQNHRLRIINVGAFAEFQVQVDEHELAVTEVDGTDVAPISCHRININPAQRYSVIIQANASQSGTFWLRARMIMWCFFDPPKTVMADALGVVRYGAAAASLPTSVDWEERLADKCRDMNTTDLVPVERIPAPPADAFFYVPSSFEIRDYRLSRGFLDHSSWRPNPRSPSLLRVVDGLSEGNASFSHASANGESHGAAFINDVAFHRPRELVLQTTGIQTLDLLISNFDDGTHPFHLHGYKFFVLAQGHGYPPMLDAIDGTTRENIQPLYDSLDLTNPLRRDTVSVEGFGWVLIRVVADNPGAWALHCHVSWHTEAGLLMQLLTRTDLLPEIDVPEENRALCAAEGVEKGMAPDDESYADVAEDAMPSFTDDIGG